MHSNQKGPNFANNIYYIPTYIDLLDEKTFKLFTKRESNLYIKFIVYKNLEKLARISKNLENR